MNSFVFLWMGRLSVYFVLKEHRIARHYHLKCKEKYRNCQWSLKKRSGIFKKGALVTTEYLKNSSVIVPLHWRQVFVLLTCWPKKLSFFFRWWICKKIFSTHNTWDLFRKRNCFLYFVLCNSGGMSWSITGVVLNQLRKKAKVFESFWRLVSSGMLRCVVWWEFIDLPQVHPAFITTPVIEAASTSETSINFYHTTRW
jgi:hypothetical protein